MLCNFFCWTILKLIPLASVFTLKLPLIFNISSPFLIWHILLAQGKYLNERGCFQIQHLIASLVIVVVCWLPGNGFQLYHHHPHLIIVNAWTLCSIMSRRCRSFYSLFMLEMDSVLSVLLQSNSRHIPGKCCPLAIESISLINQHTPYIMVRMHFTDCVGQCWMFPVGVDILMEYLGLMLLLKPLRRFVVGGDDDDGTFSLVW